MNAQTVFSAAVIFVVLHVILLTVAYLIYVERKLSAYIQDRLGPNRVGKFGLLQPIADGIKFLLKEDYRPRGADLALFTLAPAAIILPALIGWAVIPWGGYVELGDLTLPLIGQIEGGRVLAAGADVNVGVIFILAVASLGVYGVTIGGWASNNKYGLFGALRATAGMISYEIPLTASVLAVLLLSGAVHAQTLVDRQVAEGWYVLYQPLAALLFFICILAEANRAPFDNAEAEQELVAGYHTEYSSMRFAMFFLAEYAHMLTSSAFLVLLFFGGYHLPLIGWTSPEAVGVGPMLVKFLVFFTKTLLVLCLMIVIRWTLPRVRWDQLLKLCWNALIPTALALVVVSAVMAHLAWTAWWQMLLMNLAIVAVVLALQPAMPDARERNRKVRLAGSRFSPLPGERIITAASAEHSIEEQSAGASTRPLAGAH